MNELINHLINLISACMKDIEIITIQINEPNRIYYNSGAQDPPS